MSFWMTSGAQRLKAKTKGGSSSMFFGGYNKKRRRNFKSGGTFNSNRSTRRSSSNSHEPEPLEAGIGGDKYVDNYESDGVERFASQFYGKSTKRAKGSAIITSSSAGAGLSSYNLNKNHRLKPKRYSPQFNNSEEEDDCFGDSNLHYDDDDNDNDNNNCDNSPRDSRSMSSNPFASDQQSDYNDMISNRFLNPRNYIHRHDDDDDSQQQMNILSSRNSNNILRTKNEFWVFDESSSRSFSQSISSSEKRRKLPYNNDGHLQNNTNFNSRESENPFGHFRYRDNRRSTSSSSSFRENKLNSKEGRELKKFADYNNYNSNSISKAMIRGRQQHDSSIHGHHNNSLQSPIFVHHSNDDIDQINYDGRSSRSNVADKSTDQIERSHPRQYNDDTNYSVLRPCSVETVRFFNEGVEVNIDGSQMSRHSVIRTPLSTSDDRAKTAVSSVKPITWSSKRSLFIPTTPSLVTSTPASKPSSVDPPSTTRPKISPFSTKKGSQAEKRGSPPIPSTCTKSQLLAFLADKIPELEPNLHDLLFRNGTDGNESLHIEELFTVLEELYKVVDGSSDFFGENGEALQSSSAPSFSEQLRVRSVACIRSVEDLKIELLSSRKQIKTASNLGKRPEHRLRQQKQQQVWKLFGTEVDESNRRKPLHWIGPSNNNNKQNVESFSAIKVPEDLGVNKTTSIKNLSPALNSNRPSIQPRETNTVDIIKLNKDGIPSVVVVKQLSDECHPNDKDQSERIDNNVSNNQTQESLQGTKPPGPHKVLLDELFVGTSSDESEVGDVNCSNRNDSVSSSNLMESIVSEDDLQQAMVAAKALLNFQSNNQDKKDQSSSIKEDEESSTCSSSSQDST